MRLCDVMRKTSGYCDRGLRGRELSEKNVRGNTKEVGRMGKMPTRAGIEPVIY